MNATGEAAGPAGGPHARAAEVPPPTFQTRAHAALLHQGYRVVRALDSCKAHSAVLLAVASRHGGALVAVKVVDVSDAVERRYAARELRALQQASDPHPAPHVVPLLEAFCHDDALMFFVTPYMAGGDLCDLLVAPAGSDVPLAISEAQARRNYRSIALGLAGLHQRQVAHGDLSLENVVLDDQGDCRLIDLGSASCQRYMPIADYRYRSKLGYMAPEVALGAAKDEPFSTEGIDLFAVDIWALGTCLYPLLTGRQLYASPADAAYMWIASGDIATVLAIYHSRHNVPIPESARRLLCWLLRPNPRDRPSIEEVLADPWLQCP